MAEGRMKRMLENLLTEDDFDIDEGKLRDILGLDTDEPLQDQVDSAEEVAQMAFDAVQDGEVSRDEMASMLVFPTNIGDDPFFEDVLDYWNDLWEEEEEE